MQTDGARLIVHVIVRALYSLNSCSVPTKAALLKNGVKHCSYASTHAFTPTFLAQMALGTTALKYAVPHDLKAKIDCQMRCPAYANLLVLHVLLLK